MARFLTICALVLSLVGCGKEFTADRSPTNNIAKMGDAGEAGETSEGGAAGSAEGGSDTKGGQAGALVGGGSGGQAGSGTGGDSSQAGSGGTLAGGGGQAGTFNQAGSGQAGSSGAPPVMICNAGATQCSNGSFQTCRSDGSAWDSQACGFVCDPHSGCGGSCVPGDRQCSGTDSQTCDPTGHWVTVTACPFVCGGKGVCGGECVPTTQQCSGVNAQTCNSGGYWATTQSCPIACNYTGSQASCGGACVNGTHQCSGSKVPQTCVANEWTSGAQCNYVCTSSTGQCGGECVPGSQKCGAQGGVQTCSSAGTWQAEGAACPFICTDGACGGQCVPNAGCADDGNACTDDVCNATGTACTHPSKTNGVACGSSSSSACDNPDSCQAGVCQPNPKAANTACTSDGNTCTTDVCDGAGACQHPAAPAATVCRAAGCSGGVVTAQATCGGSTSCPVAQTTSCFGSCDAGGLVCANTAPQKVDDVSGAPLATDNDSLYFYASTRTTSGVSQVVRYAKSGGAKTVLYQTTDPNDWIYALIVAGNYLYLGETNQVSRITTTGTLQTANVISGQTTYGFAKNSTRVFWSDARQSNCVCSNPLPTHIYSTAIGDTAVQQFSFTFNGVEISTDIEVDDLYLYVWQLATTYSGPQTVAQVYAPALRRYSLSTPAADNTEVQKAFFTEGNITYYLTSNYTKLPGLTKAGTLIYGNANLGSFSSPFLTQGGNNVIVKVTPDGTATVVTKTSPIGLTQNFVADASYVYVEDMRVPVGGGSAAYWTNQEIANFSLSSDGTSLYFGSWGYWNDLPYDNIPDVQTTALYKVTKP